MSTTDNHRQNKLAKPTIGEFSRKEFAVYGTTCEKIRSFYNRLNDALAQFDVAFADADHEPSVQGNSAYHEKNPGFSITSTWNANVFLRRNALAQTDLVVVNGNHFHARHQIIVCDASKEISLRKRAAELTNVVAIVTMEVADAIPQYVKELIPSHADIPKFSLQAFGELSDWIQETYLDPPVLKALIVAGGESTRMGFDKTMFAHHGVPQVKHLAQILENFKLDVFISCKHSQQEKFENLGLKTITDRILDIGPIGGITSAMMQYPDEAWLVIAADLPLLDEEVIGNLINKRSSTHIGTAYISNSDGLPEPLIAIWEPKSYPLLLSFLAQGISCPRKVMINSSTHLLNDELANKLINVNTPDDLENLRKKNMIRQ